MSEFEIAETGRLYRDAFIASVGLEAQIAAQGSNAEAEAGLRQSQLIMELAADEAADAFGAVISHQPVDPHAIRRTDLQALRDNPTLASLHPKIDSQLAELPMPETYSSEDRSLALYLLRGLGKVPVASEADVPPVDRSIDASPEPTSDTSPADPENARLRQPLNVLVCKGDSVLVLDDGKAVLPLSRQLEIGSSTVEEEKKIEAARLKVYEILATRPDDTLRPSELWTLVFGTDVPFSSGQWGIYMNDFISKATYNEQPLIITTKPTETARRKVYGLGDYQPVFSYTDEAYGLEDNTIYRLTTGGMLIGSSAKVMHALMAATADKPLEGEQLLTLLSDEEKARNKSPGTLLSSYVSSIRARLRDQAADLTYVIHKVDHPTEKTAANRPVATYWIEELPYDAEKQQELNSFYLASRYILMRNGLLAMLNLPQLDPTAAKPFTALVPHKLQNIDNTDMLTQAPGAVVQLHEKANFDIDYVEAIMDNHEKSDDEIRMALIDYLYKIDANKTGKLFCAAMKATVEATESTPEGILVTYNVEGHGRVVVLESANELNPLPNGNGTPEPAAETRSPRSLEIEKLVMPHVDKVRDTLEAAGHNSSDHLALTEARKLFKELTIEELKESNGGKVGQICPNAIVHVLARRDKQLTRVLKHEFSEYVAVIHRVNHTDEHVRTAGTISEEQTVIIRSSN